MSRSIRICADDFGMNAEVNAGIIALAHKGVMSGTSCLVDGPAFAAGIPMLQRSEIEIGLHLNFTEDFGQLGPIWPLRDLIVKSYLKRLPHKLITASVERQIDKFRADTGHLPHYVDGHQHVHQLPAIRNILLSVLCERYQRRDLPWIRHGATPRVSRLPLGLQLKAQIIRGLGGKALRTMATAAGYGVNLGFCGVYDFRGGQDGYLRLLDLWLQQCRKGDALMCHPAMGATPEDALTEQRQAEFATLASAGFRDLLLKYGVTVVRPRA